MRIIHFTLFISENTINMQENYAPVEFSMDEWNSGGYRF